MGDWRRQPLATVRKTRVTVKSGLEGLVPVISDHLGTAPEADKMGPMENVVRVQHLEKASSVSLTHDRGPISPIVPEPVRFGSVCGTSGNEHESKWPGDRDENPLSQYARPEPRSSPDCHD